MSTDKIMKSFKWPIKIKKGWPENMGFITFLTLSASLLVVAEAAVTLPDLAPWIKGVVAFAHIPFTILVAVLAGGF